MCSAFFFFKAQAELLFLLAFNRDEYFDRLVTLTLATLILLTSPVQVLQSDPYILLPY